MKNKTQTGKDAKKHASNKLAKTAIKENAKDIRKAAQKQDHTLAEEKLGQIIPRLDLAARKKVIHKNTAARKKSRLTKKVNALKSSSQ